MHITCLVKRDAFQVIFLFLEILIFNLLFLLPITPYTCSSYPGAIAGHVILIHLFELIFAWEQGRNHLDRHQAGDLFSLDKRNIIESSNNRLNNGQWGAMNSQPPPLIAIVIINYLLSPSTLTFLCFQEIVYVLECPKVLTEEKEMRCFAYLTEDLST